MTDPDGFDQPTKDELIVAAIRLVDAIVEHRHPTVSRPSTAPKVEPELRGPRVVKLSDIRNIPEIVSNPIIGSLKRSLCEIGQMLYDVAGSTEALVDLAEQIANRDPENYARRISPINSAWEGVGRDTDRWRS